MASRLRNTLWMVSAGAFIGYVWMVGSHKLVNQDYFQMFTYVVEGTKVRRIRNDLFTAYTLLCKLQFVAVPAGLLVPPLLAFNFGLLILSRLFSFLRPIRDFVLGFRHYSYNLTNEAHMFAEVNSRFAHVDDFFELLLLLGSIMMLFHLAAQTSFVGVLFKTLFPGYVQTLTCKPQPPAAPETSQADKQRPSSKPNKKK